MDSIINKLESLQKLELIRPIDLELCRFLRDRHPRIEKEVLLAAALTCHLYQQGHVCLPLADYAGQQLFDEEHDDIALQAPDLEQWRQSLQNCPAVGTPGEYKPLILDTSDRLYLHKFWYYEHSLATKLIQKSSEKIKDCDEQLLKDGLDRLFNTAEQPDWQQVAAATSIFNKLSIISGGPGTGKTSTVVRILALVLEQYQQRDKNLNIVLAAPTGKAAARLKDSIVNAKEELNVSEAIRSAIPEKAQTVHQLLGARRYSSQFRYNADNPVPYDLIIVDEASMVDQALMSKLTEALLDDARLILLGDKDQLASVEAGSVLGDICDRDVNQFSTENAARLAVLSLNLPDKFLTDSDCLLIDNITLLTKSYRFESKSGIAKLSKYVNSGEADRALDILANSQYKDISLHQIESIEGIKQIYEQKLIDYFNDIVNADSAHIALKKFNRFRILAAHRKGPLGIRHLNQLAETILQQRELIPKYAQWYPGKPVIINVNDYTLELFNGDIGVCLPDEQGEMKVYFEDDGEVRGFAHSRLPDHNKAYTLTVHKSQGSEFDEVMLVLPDRVSKVLSRELIYTALTRARSKISIVGKETILRAGIKKSIRRSSGLRDYLW